MTRTISKSMASILEELELENKSFVTLSEIEMLARENNIMTEPATIAARLKQSGWLLPTSQRGVWEFAPAAVAGPYSKNDPLREVKAYRIANPDATCYLCLQTAAWAQGFADRIPSVKELAFETIPRKHISIDIRTYRYAPAIDTIIARGVPCLAPESIIVHLSLKPDQVRSWESVMEWLPDVVYESDKDKLLLELASRTDSVKQRTGYLLQGMYPEAAEAIMEITKPKSKVRFGTRGSSLRNDEKWKISDTLLPFSVKNLEKIK